jgi:uncharacterized membrane protein YphA (DoxX/SURF4 family)
MLIIRNLSRYIAAIVFLFSAIVKGVDPLGTAYRLEDYFIAYGTQWASSLSLAMSIGLSSLEFIIGLALLLNLRMRITSWALLLIMSFFTVLTFFDAIYEPVSDCGCFGDAIKLTNWETFYKNMFLMVFTILIFVQRKNFNSVAGVAQQNLLIGLGLTLFFWFSIYNYRHLPMLDFRAWKVGNKMTGDEEAKMEVYLKYRNKSTGEEKEYLSPNYPWNDSLWMGQWEFVDQRVVTLGQKTDHGLYAEDEFGTDHTDYILGYDDYMALGVVYDFKKAKPEALGLLFSLTHDFDDNNIPLIILTSSLPEEVTELRQKYGFEHEVLYADAVALKTIIRANPGLVLLRSGTVEGKWHWRELPKGTKRSLWVQNLRK